MRLLVILLLVPSLLTAQTPAYQVVRGDGYVAHVHRPLAGDSAAAVAGARVRVLGATRAPAVLLIGGSGGGIGWQDYMAERLAERGFVAMAVAYFGMEGLPAALERIPL
jgi:hypothetical protein